MKTTAVRIAGSLALLTAVLSAVPEVAAQDFLQIGQYVNGEDLGESVGGELFGIAVSLSSDGRVLAAGAPATGTSGFQTGHVRVFEWNDSDWSQRGGDLEGAGDGDLFGQPVSLSANGNIVAVGARSAGALGSTGHVQVYEWNGTDWAKLGTDIDGDSAGDQFGWSVSLSSAGTVVAIGAHTDNGGGTNRGHVRVFEWSGTAWIQRGDDIDGEANYDLSGSSVSISSNGNVLAVGARGNDGGGLNSGHVRVFDWSGTAWIQRGNDIEGEGSGDASGSRGSVSLSADGSVIAIGARGNAPVPAGPRRGHVRVFDWNGTAWTQRGADIDGEADDEGLGFSVSLSSDGNTVAAADILNDSAARNAGQVRVYRWNGTDWVQQGTDIDGETGDEQSGTSISLSSDGNMLAVGAPFNSIAGYHAGQVRTFGYDLDNDNVSDFVEGMGPNSGDGNSDSIADSEQAEVASFPIVSGPHAGEFVTIVADDGTSIQSASSIENPAPDDYPNDVVNVFGFLAFKLTGLSPGSATQVSVLLPPDTSPNEYWKYGPTPDDATPHWYEFSYDGTTGAEFADNIVTLHFVDGERGDSDLTANGEITDPGAPVVFSGQCTFDDLPSWDGNLTIAGGAAPTASAVLTVPNGFHALEVLDASDNIGLLDVDGLSPLSSTGPIASSLHPGALFERLEYAGTGDAPTVVTAVFGPQEADGSRFLFQLTDRAGCTLQVDPQIDFDTPKTVTLSDNYPNPFNPSTRISFTLPEAQDVRLRVYDLMGREIRTLISGRRDAGTHQAEWDGTNEAGAEVASGVYLYRLDAGSVSHTRQMILMK